jgi:general L-amino acid transport system substrate-binding protein
VCGVNTGLAGFSAVDSQGNWVGLTWTCKAIAAAVLGDGKKVKWVPLNAQQRFTALQSARSTSSAQLDVHADARRVARPLDTVVTYYDGQGFHRDEEGQDHQRQATEECRGVRAVRHDDRKT